MIICKNNTASSIAVGNKKTVADSIFFEYDKFERRLKGCRFSLPNSMKIQVLFWRLLEVVALIKHCKIQFLINQLLSKKYIFV